MMDIPKSLLLNNIGRGVILHSTIFDSIDHGKFFVVVGVTDSEVAGFFFINSNINKSIEAKPEQFAMQYPMKKSDYSFLRYDSFLSATRILKLPCEKIVDSISEGITEIIGNMKKEHMDELLENARASRLFSNQEKKAFLY
ncbi:MAG: hypothetical protein SOW45_09270 [Prevotella sp.]|nr:hypothetical protein [Prevotella sp.]